MMFTLAACSGSSGKQVESKTTSNDSVALVNNNTTLTSYSAKIFKNPDGTFGYTILENNSAIIQQIVIPALSGNNGFPDSLKAKITADLVLEKLNNKIFPPTVSVDEINSILNQK